MVTVGNSAILFILLNFSFLSFLMKYLMQTLSSIKKSVDTAPNRSKVYNRVAQFSLKENVIIKRILKINVMFFIVANYKKIEKKK